VEKGDRTPGLASESTRDKVVAGSASTLLFRLRRDCDQSGDRRASAAQPGHGGWTTMAPVGL